MILPSKRFLLPSTHILSLWPDDVHQNLLEKAERAKRQDRESLLGIWHRGIIAGVAVCVLCTCESLSQSAKAGRLSFPGQLSCDSSSSSFAMSFLFFLFVPATTHVHGRLHGLQTTQPRCAPGSKRLDQHKRLLRACRLRRMRGLSSFCR